MDPTEATDSVTKSKNQLKNEAKKAEKLAKFAAKQEKLASQAPKTLNLKQEDVEIESVPAGELKSFDKPMSKDYFPKPVEAAWYAWWEKCGFFKPEQASADAEPFTIVMPPPNVTGSLHVGHSLMLAVEDALVRWHRMSGRAVLFLPGCDHAGISTQTVVEKKLARERNVTRHDLGREGFLAEVWKWKEQYGERIYEQIRRMGASCDWDRARFTMDPMASAAVVESFIRMFDGGLIFRANRLVHWSGKLRTSISDLEVDQHDVAASTWMTCVDHDPKRKYPFGMLWSVAYRVEGEVSAGCPSELVVATTRPETLFADVAIAVHPEDERYKPLLGRKVIHPLLGTAIPVIADTMVDPAFGTGAVKISPAHDHNDFAVAQRHGLPYPVIFDESNLLNERCGRYAGMKRFDARLAIIEQLKADGTFRGEQGHNTSLPKCNRTGDIVEPRLIPQWWVNCNSMAERACEAVRTGELVIRPKEHERVWFHWLENIRDWCISRQLWWGHRIPAYLVKHASGEVWVAARSEEEARAKSKVQDIISIEQDPDVLDTWFSSGLWPFSTLGWPENSADLERFFPNSLLETGTDILFFWVARMAMMSLYLTGKVPFKEVFLHALVRDAHGRKMSKSLGNVVDPIDVIEGITLEELHQRLEQGNLDPVEHKRAKEGQKQDFPKGIPECGTDALRFGLCSYVTPSGSDINLSVPKLESFRRFCNKIWNACWLVRDKCSDIIGKEVTELNNLTSAERWILHRLNVASEAVNKAMSEYNLMQATMAVRTFWLDDLCDVYLEVSKPQSQLANQSIVKASQACLLHVTLQALKLIHPFMPFISEELFHRLGGVSDGCRSIMVAPFPQPCERWSQPAADFDSLYEMIKRIRSIHSEVKPPKGSEMRINAPDADRFLLIQQHEHIVAWLTRNCGVMKLSNLADPQGHPVDDYGTTLSY